MNKGFVALLTSVFAAGALCSAEIPTAVWNASDIGQTVTNAAEWFASANWTDGTVPNGAGWKAEVLKNATGTPFIKIGSPLELAGLSTLKYASGKDAVTFVSEHPIRLSVENQYSTVGGGRFFADMEDGTSERFGYNNAIELSGRIEAGELVMANEVMHIRLDQFAKSADPMRDGDIVLDSIYHGSGYLSVTAPRKGEAHEGEWYVEASSPYVFRKGNTPKIAAGAVVSCGDVFPEGTFVKRIFSDYCIELSAPASASAGNGEKTIAFAAITPRTRIYLPHFKMVTYSQTYTSFCKYNADDDFRVEVERLYSTRVLDANGPTIFLPNLYQNPGSYPATIVIHDAAGGGTGNNSADRGYYHQDKYANSLLVLLGNCHLEFAETGREGAVPGFPDSVAMTQKNIGASTKTRLTVTNNIHAAIGCFTNFYHIVEKDGAGSLMLGLTNNVSLNTGTLVVKEGTVVLPEGSWVKTIAVSNGATLRISGEIAPENFVAEPGARIAGEGTLLLGDAKFASGVKFVEGACLQVPGVNELRTEAPATNVPASVAFWVDASRMDTITFADELLTNVVRIADVRGEAYGFATNTLGGYPRLVRDHRGRPHHINLPWVSSAQGQTDPDKCIALIWDKPYTNIRAVFQVLDTRDGGGQFLGMTSRISGNDFMRPAGTDSRTYSAPIFYSKNTGCDEVRSGPFYANGRLYNPDNGYPYPGGGATRNLEDGNAAKWSAPAVFSAHPISNTQADAFAFNAGAGSRSGYHRVCECLIFTNEVTETERLAITGYLMKKWLNHEIDFDAADGNPFPDVDAEKIGGIGVSDGESMYVAKISGAAEFFKKGAGTLYINDYAVAEGSLDVAAGNLTINSRLPPDIADIPEGAYVHFDASDVSTLTVKSSGQVSEWRDIRGEGYHKATHLSSTNNSYATVTATPRGMNAIDFGPYKGREDGSSWDDKQDSPIMKYPACGELHSVFMVMDSSQGGGVLVGCGQDPNSLRGPYCGYGLRRFETIETLSYAAPILTNALTNSDGKGQKNLSYEGGSRARLNGQRINPLTTGFSGGWDLVSLVSYEDFGGGSFAAANYNKYVGGQKIGEAILYKEGLNERQVDAVEAYLNWKWFGKATPGYRPAVVSNLTVRSGATLSVVGGAPLTVNGTFSVQGTVSGDVALAGGAELVVVVGADGSVSTSGFAGALDLSNGVKVRLCGEVNKLAPGEYTIAQTAGLTFSASGSSVVSDVPFKRNLSLGLGTDGNALVLKVLAPGLRVIVR